jgi:limonene-1,2-epoxide hydrolase
VENYRIRDLEHYLSLWRGIYSSTQGPSWDHFLPYYDDNIYFKDSVQEIRGIEDFRAMTQRLAKRSRKLEVIIHSSSMQNDLIFIEWELIVSYKKYPKSSIFGVSRTILKDGKIIDQRDYYDLWGDILDNIKFIAKGYRRFMRKRFG